jgi:predicted component of type VI protein secretion system
VLRDQEGNLSFLVHPELRTIVQSEVLAYLESLLGDFLERAKLHPETLFKQLSSLGVEPLVTKEAGTSISDFLSL